MSEWFTLAALAAVLYLVECLAWIDAPSVACFKGSFRRVWRSVQGTMLPGNDSGGLVVVDPIGFRGSVVLCHRWPLSLSPAGVTTLAFDNRQDQTADAVFISFEQVTEVRGELGDVLINGVRVARLGSTVLASQLADQIRSLWQCAPAKRQRAITSAVAATLDDDAASATWTAFHARTVLLAALCESLFAFTFIAAPLILILIGPYPAWMYLLGGIVGLTAGTAFIYFRSHVALYPHARYDRWVNTLSMVLLPVAAIRCVDKLAKDALCGYSWAVVSPLLCTPDGAVELSRLRLMDMRSWSNDVVTTTHGDAAECAHWFHDLLMTETEAALDRLKVPALEPPARDDQTMICFCPRCHAQFRKLGPECPACVGIQLMPFINAPGNSASLDQARG